MQHPSGDSVSYPRCRSHSMSSWPLFCSLIFPEQSYYLGSYHTSIRTPWCLAYPPSVVNLTSPRQLPIGKLHPLPVPERPRSHIMVDWSTSLWGPYRCHGGGGSVIIVLLVHISPECSHSVLDCRSTSDSHFLSLQPANTLSMDHSLRYTHGTCSFHNCKSMSVSRWSIIHNQTGRQSGLFKSWAGSSGPTVGTTSQTGQSISSGLSMLKIPFQSPLAISQGIGCGSRQMTYISASLAKSEVLAFWVHSLFFDRLTLSFILSHLLLLCMSYLLPVYLSSGQWFSGPSRSQMCQRGPIQVNRSSGRVLSCHPRLFLTSLHWITDCCL